MCGIVGFTGIYDAEKEQQGHCNLAVRRNGRHDACFYQEIEC